MSGAILLGVSHRSPLAPQPVYPRQLRNPSGSLLLSNALRWAILAAFFIARQFMPGPVQGWAMIVILLIGGHLGLRARGKTPPDSLFAAGVVGFNLAVAVVTGVARGAAIRLRDDRTGTTRWLVQTRSALWTL